eukprot:EG_transcript_11444
MKRHCKHWLPKKKRFCHFEPLTADGEYCNHHLPNGADPQRQRVICPIDPNHTVWAAELDKHVKKCPYLKFLPNEKPYYEKDVNLVDPLADASTKLGQLQQLCEVQFQHIQKTVCDIYSRFVNDTISTEILSPDWGISLYQEGDVQKEKHVAQQSSIAAHLQKVGLLSPALTYVEFGAGKGGLSYFLSRVAPGCSNVLVDRKNFKRKLDAVVRFEKEFHRLYIDIKDLVLGKVPALQGTACVAVSKHLCGTATDLTLQCIARTVGPPPGDSGAPADASPVRNEAAEHPANGAPVSVQGAAIALCCHHVCHWNSYVGRTFLEENGLSEADFPFLCSLTSWACCGWRQAPEQEAKERKVSEAEATSKGTEIALPSVTAPGSSEDFTKVDSEPVTASSDPAPKGLPWDGWSVEERRQFGLRCKRVLDHGRVQYLQRAGYHCRLVYFVAPECSLENTLLLCWRT